MVRRELDIAAAGGGGGGKRVEKLALAVVHESKLPARRRADAFEQALESLPHPSPRRGRSIEQQSPGRVDCTEGQRFEPDRERALVDAALQLGSDRRPVAPIGTGRLSELCGERAAIERDPASPRSATNGHVLLDDRDLTGGAPPVRGLGAPVPRFLDSLLLRAWGGGVWGGLFGALSAKTVPVPAPFPAETVSPATL